jgi:hypothetical protein
MRHAISSPRGSRRGGTLVQMVLCLTAVIGIMAVALDGGMLLVQRRSAQAAADAAALAGAADLFNNWLTYNGADHSNAAKKSALATALANGYPNAEVTVNIPPTSGDHANQAGFVEVIITHQQPRYFSLIWGSANIPVSARAVAGGRWKTGDASILVLNPSGTTVTGNGNTGINIAGPFIVNSTGPNVFNLPGNPTITANEFDFAGNSSPPSLGLSSSQVSQDLLGPGGSAASIAYSQTPTADPLSFLPPPSTTGLTAQSYTGQSTLNPGIYNGISVSGNTTVTLTSGTYIINGSISLSGGATIDGTSGVLIYINPGAGNSAITTNGNPSLKLFPMTTGPYQGISIYVDRSATDSTLTIGGTAGWDIEGTIYAPSSTISLNGTPGAVSGSELIVNKLNMVGNAVSTVGSSNKAPHYRYFQLVE